MTTFLSSFSSHIYVHCKLLSREDKKVYALQKLNAKLQVLSKLEETSDFWANLEDDNSDAKIKKPQWRFVSQTPSPARLLLKGQNGKLIVWLSRDGNLSFQVKVCC